MGYIDACFEKDLPDPAMGSRDVCDSPTHLSAVQWDEIRISVARSTLYWELRMSVVRGTSYYDFSSTQRSRRLVVRFPSRSPLHAGVQYCCTPQTTFRFVRRYHQICLLCTIWDVDFLQKFFWSCHCCCWSSERWQMTRRLSVASCAPGPLRPRVGFAGIQHRSSPLLY